MAIKTKRNFPVFFFGVVLGLALAMGLIFGMSKWSPQSVGIIFASLGQKAAEGQGLNQGSVQDLVKDTVQDILASPQVKTVISDLMNSQATDNFQKFFLEAMESQEFRKALGEALETFLKSPEGKELLRKIAADALRP